MVQYDHYVSLVQRRARLGSRNEAIWAVRATLETLADRLSRTQLQLLAARLPAELGMYLSAASTGQEFSLDEFFERVGARARAEKATAGRAARVVLSLLSELVGGLEIGEARSKLPEDVASLLQPAV